MGDSRHRICCRFGAAIRLLTVLLTGLLMAPFATRAEFKVGEALPAFSVKDPAGATLSLEQVHGRVLVKYAGEEVTPRVVVLHLFQPDCLQCQAQMAALERMSHAFNGRDVLVLGVAHCGDAAAIRSVARQLKIPFPLFVGTNSPVAERFAAGDTLGIVDSGGVVRFAQVGYGKGDEEVWVENIRRLLAGQPVRRETIARERLQIGDRLPAVNLPSLATGHPLSLAGESGRLKFVDDGGMVMRPAAAIVMFSRFWTFSREEMVHLQKFHERYSRDGLLVLVISMFPYPDQARAASRELGVTYSVANGEGSDLGRRYAYGWPAYIADAGGVIRYTQVGFEAGDEKKYEQVIQALIRRHKDWMVCGRNKATTEGVVTIFCSSR